MRNPLLRDQLRTTAVAFRNDAPTDSGAAYLLDEAAECLAKLERELAERDEIELAFSRQCSALDSKLAEYEHRLRWAAMYLEKMSHDPAYAMKAVIGGIRETLCVGETDADRAMLADGEVPAHIADPRVPEGVERP